MANVRLGVLVVPTDPWPDTVALARRLDRLGYHHLWTYDHLSWRRYRDRPWHATYPWLTGLAGATERIRLGTMVSNPNIRHPLVLAKDAMTIDHISGGRLTIGIGAGGVGYDATVMGQAPLTPVERIDRLEEYVDVLDRLLRGTVADHDGDHYRLDGARMVPGCIQSPRVPIAVAAGGRRGLRLTADIADAWITYGDTGDGDLTPEGTERVVRGQVQLLEHRCEEIGRDSAEIDRIYLIGNTEERPLASLETFDEFVERYAALGFTDLVFHHPRADDAFWDDDPEIVEAIAEAYLGS